MYIVHIKMHNINLFFLLEQEGCVPYSMEFIKTKTKKLLTTLSDSSSN